jgi:hypothetical protein
MSEADQQVILSKLNSLRRYVANGLELRGNPGPQPPASNMRELRWDVELAIAAQNKTDLCIMGYITRIPAGIKILILKLSYLVMSVVKIASNCRFVEVVWTK